MEKIKSCKHRVKKQNPFFETDKCWYFDGINQYGNPVTECMKPWSNKCDGNQHNCKHLKMQYLASLTPEKRKAYLDKYE